MNKKGRLLLVAVLVCPLDGAVAHAQKESEREIVFELSEEAQPWTKLWEGVGVIKPTHVAVVTHKEIPYANLCELRSLTGYVFVKEQLDKKLLSQKQLAFIEQRKLCTVLEEQGDLYTTVRLYGVTQDDARKMARAYIEMMDDRASGREEDARKALEDYQRQTAEAEKMVADYVAENELAKAEKEKDISECKVELERKKAIVEEAKADFYYQSLDDAQESMLKYNTMVNLLVIVLPAMRQR